MAIHPLAGRPVPDEELANASRLVTAFFMDQPDPGDPGHGIRFGTSGHRGSSLKRSFNMDHILAMTQAVCDFRAREGGGPLYLGKDTHALSEPAIAIALEVLAANGVETFIQEDGGYTPTPVISHAILSYNRNRPSAPADGIAITPSHNPPDDGGFKYNPAHGGPAGGEVTSVIQNRANEILGNGNREVKRIPLEAAMRSGVVHPYDYIRPYVSDLGQVLDMEAIAGSGLKLGADPMGGAGIAFWDPIAEAYKLDITVVNRKVDPAFGFMRLDKDGKVRMDCSSPYAMAGLLEHKDDFDLAFGNDPDFDRHGIVTPDGLMNPNHYLAASIWYLFAHRPQWPDSAAIGKTLVSSAIIDRLAKGLGRTLSEVPVGFKWFVSGLLEGSYAFGGEESAGASFVRKDGSVWTTDKDGIIMDLLAAEMTAVTGRNPSETYKELTDRFGDPLYERLQAPADHDQKKVLQNLSEEMVRAADLAGEPVLAKLTHAPGNLAPIGGLKVVTENGWFAARPSGTEDIYKIYTESFKGPDHLAQIQEEAQEIVNTAFLAAGV